MTTLSLVSSRTRLGFSLGSNSLKNEQVWKPSRFTLIKLKNALQLTNTVKPVGNGHSIGKRQGDHYKQGDRYIQVNFAENMRQKVLVKEFFLKKSACLQ